MPLERMVCLKIEKDRQDRKQNRKRKIDLLKWVARKYMFTISPINILER